MTGGTVAGDAYLTHDELCSLSFDHKYKSNGCSFLDTLCMRDFWTWLVEFLPLKHDQRAPFHWTAPNTLTLTGLFCMVIPAGLIMVQEPILSPIVPWYLYLAQGVGLFLYQTADSLDGKQARRTGSSSPFGELFDHGCDAFSTFVQYGGFVCMLRGGLTPLSFAAYMAAQNSFAAAHIQSYYRGELFFGFFDVTEIQFIGISCNLACAFFGPAWLEYNVYGVRAGDLPLWGTIFGTVCAITGNVWTTLDKRKNVAYAVTPRHHLWGHLILLNVIATLWYQARYQVMAPADGLLFFIGIGALVAVQSVVVIVAHMARTPFPLHAHARTIPTILFGLAAYTSTMSDSTAVAYMLACNLTFFCHYSLHICLDISTFLGISVFKCAAPTTIDPRPRKAE